MSTTEQLQQELTAAREDWERCAMELADAVRERDEARAEVERLRSDLLLAGQGVAGFEIAADAATRHLKELRETLEELQEAREKAKDAYRRGAEAMREACVNVVLTELSDPWYGDELLVPMRALPIPEEK